MVLPPSHPNISIRSPLTRGDRGNRAGEDHDQRFQSAPLSRGETGRLPHRAGGGFNFNPLPSHEGRLYPRGRGSGENDFNPLPSHEGRRRLHILEPDL